MSKLDRVEADYLWTFRASVGDTLPVAAERDAFELSEIDRALSKRGLALTDELTVAACACKRCKSKARAFARAMEGCK